MQPTCHAVMLWPGSPPENSASVAYLLSILLLRHQPLFVTLALSIGMSHWASRTERCLFLVSCWLHPPERLSCFVEMQDTWLELAWHRCQGHCASSITPVPTLREVMVAKKSTVSSRRGPVGSNMNRHIVSGLTCYFAILYVLQTAFTTRQFTRFIKVMHYFKVITFSP